MGSKSVSIADITIGKRHRKDLGDLQGLADSIEAEGLLQAIGITSDKTLVFGERRLRAVQDILKGKTIAARIVNVSSIAAGEYAENEIRKDFTTSERVAIAEALPSFKHGGDRKSETTDQDQEQNFALDDAAKKAGLGNKETYRQAKKAVEKGSAALVKAMDEGTVKPSVAAKLAELPKAEQNKALAAGKVAIKAAVQKPRPDWAQGPNPSEQADASPGRRWHATLHKLYVFMNSTRDLGGIKDLTKKWTDDCRKEYVAELKRIIGELQKWITILEKSTK